MQPAATLRRRAAHIRRTSLQMVHRARLGHPGGDLSAADILAVLYFDVLHVDPAGAAPCPTGIASFSARATAPPPCMPCSRTPASFPKHTCSRYMQPLSPLNGHPDRNKVPGVEANTGPLGHGLPIAVGHGARRKDGRGGLAHVRADRRRRAPGGQQLGGGDVRRTVPTGQPHRHRRPERAPTRRRDRAHREPRAAARSLAILRLGRRRRRWP